MIPDRLADSGVVRIADVAPPVALDGNLWYSPVTGTLSVSRGGAWVPAGAGGGGAGLPEVHVGPAVPAQASVLIWIDTSQPEISVRYRVGAGWNDGLDGGRW